MSQERTYTIELTEDDLILIHIALGTQKHMCPKNLDAEIENLEKKLHEQRVKQFWDKTLAPVRP